jgi:hypothetical protein
MHAHWATGDGRTGAIAAARAHRATGRWTGVKGAVRAWLDVEKRRLTAGNKKHTIVKSFGAGATTAWVRAVVDEAKRAYVAETHGERGAGGSEASGETAPSADQDVSPTSVDQDVSPAVRHARNLGLLSREMTVIYTASSHGERGKRRTRTTTTTRLVYTTRAGRMAYDIRGRNSVVTGERIAIAARGAGETAWRVYPDDCDRSGRVMARDIVTNGFIDARAAINRARHATLDVAAAVVRGGFMHPAVGSATTTQGVRHHDGKIQVRVRNPNPGRVEVRAVLSDRSFSSHLIPGNDSSFYWIFGSSMTMRGESEEPQSGSCGSSRCSLRSEFHTTPHSRKRF